MMRLAPYFLCFATALGVHAPLSASDDLSVSGFASVVGGYLNEDAATYEGYDNSFSVSQQSRIGVQLDYQFTPEIAAAAQGLLHTADDRQSGIEWAYLSYTPTANINVKAGKLRTPFFSYSDVLDVGFAYRWITPPQQVYSTFFPSNYDGISGTLKFPVMNSSASVELYWGEMGDDVLIDNEEIHFGVDNQRGVITRLERGALTLRASAHFSGSAFVEYEKVSLLQQLLRNAGFTRSADSFQLAGSAEAYQLGVNWEALDYFVSSEWIRIQSDLVSGLDASAYYLTAGVVHPPFQFYATFADTDYAQGKPVDEFPDNLPPQLAPLAGAYFQVFSEENNNNLQSYSLGMRWDIRYNLAFKTEITKLMGASNERAYFHIKNNDFDRDAVLLQAAFEWVF